MALVGNKYELVISVADNSGDIVPRTYTVPFDTPADFAEFVTMVTTMLAEFNPLTAGVIVGYKMAVIFQEETVVLPASGVENENQAIFSGKIIGDSSKSGVLTIPAADPAIFVATSGPGAKVVNMANADVIAFIQLFDGAPGWTVSDGEFWNDTTVKGSRRHTKNSRG